MQTIKLLTISQFAADQPAFSEGSLRWIRFNSTTNGFASAFLKIGSRVFIDEGEFFRIIDEQNGRRPPDADHRLGAA